MRPPLKDQVIVITGAASGIGRATAQLLGRHGARLGLADQEPEALAAAAQEAEEAGGRVLPVVADVSEWRDMEELARVTAEHFGHIDTWINNAAVSAYAPIADMTIDEIERILQVDLMGQIYGMKAALPYLRRQGHGAIINVTSVLAERAVPLQGTYSAAKHGVRGFTDALRLELAREGLDIPVTMVMPSSINTPFFGHARSKTGRFPQPMAPIYHPRLAAEVIAFVAQHPRRDVVVGGGGKLLTLLQRLSPALVDRLMLLGDLGVRQQQTSWPDNETDNLFAPTGATGSVEGAFGEATTTRSPYTSLIELHPLVQRALAVAAVVGLAALLRRAGR